MGQSKTTTSTTIPEWQEKFATGTLLPQAEKVAGMEFTPYGGQFSPEMSGFTTQAGETYGGIAGMTPEQYQQRVQANLGGYQQNVIDATLAQMERQREKQRVGEEARMIGSGAFDSSRRGVYEGERQAAYELGQGNMIANLLSQGYQQALGTTAQQIGQQQAAAGGLMGAGGVEQALAGQQLAGEYGEFMRGEQFPMQQLGSLMGMGTADFGSTTTESYRPSTFDYLTAGVRAVCMTDYRAIASQYAQQYGIPQELFLRQIGAESAWNPSAVSSAGALGLAQLMPSTARYLGVDPLNPVQNLEGGAKYLRQQYDKFGDWGLALAAYNAGPGRVEQYGGIPPFEETQNYVAKILGDMQQGRGGAMTPQQQRQQRPQGLLEQIGLQRMGSGGPQGDIPFHQRDKFRDFAGRLAIAANTLRQRPDPNIPALVQHARAQRKGNRTAEWLAQQPGGEPYARLIEADPNAAASVLAAYQKQVIGGGDANVQSSEMLPDLSGTIMTLRDGSIRVVTAGGDTIEGQEAVDFVQAARDADAKYQRDIYSARREGTLGADIEYGGEAARVKEEGKDIADMARENLASAGLVQSNIINLNDAIEAIDGGAKTGVVYKMMPNVTEASASLQNAMDRMGLDVIGSVTFGALSEAELKLAMETAVPRDLNPQELRNWLVKKRDAQMKAREGLLEAANHFATGGTLAEWIEKMEEMGAGKADKGDGLTDEDLQYLGIGND